MLSNLERIDHVVVLMMANRSLDHLLGYLKLKHGMPVDGLTGAESNPGKNGERAVVGRLASTRFPTDLGHTSRDVAQQLEGPNQGFVTNYLHQPAHVDPPDAVMGYHDETQVWAYDYLARTFTVCDRWFSSVPGPTIPNRLFSLTGSSDGETDHEAEVRIYRGLRSVFDCLDRALSDRPADARWGYFFHDWPMLALLEQHVGELRAGPFRRLVRWLTGRAPRMRGIDAFFDRAHEGRLPAVAWIDPAFADATMINDDHPPTSDIYDGQALVAKVYNAILSGGAGLWERTLLVVTYDNHGGFFDHVPPPPSGDPPPFDRLGVRVPALVVSSWIPHSIDSVIRDHTCLLRTILDRFAPGEALTPRVARATGLAGLLGLEAPRTDARPIDIPRRARVSSPAGQPTDLEVRVRDYRWQLARRGLFFE